MHLYLAKPYTLTQLSIRSEQLILPQTIKKPPFKYMNGHIEDQLCYLLTKLCHSDLIGKMYSIYILGLCLWGSQGREEQYLPLVGHLLEQPTEQHYKDIKSCNQFGEVNYL